uniref:Helicase ATP-binding domain-containing protein n=1 Tax=Parastrongyloides trichosuri TaxID=131310 RepID=A0A0N4ZL84_PARTI
MNDIQIPDDFSFPYQPYSIQNDLMREIFSSIENGNVSIFESPTGTGKSLSTLCSVLTWLKLKKIKIYTTGEELEKKIRELEKEAIGNKDWLEVMKKRHDLIRSSEEALEIKEKMRRINEILKKAKENRWNKSQIKEKEIRKRKVMNDNKNNEMTIYSDDDELEPKNDDINFLNESDFKIEEDEKLRTIQIIYASRTHSQLEQLLEELKKTNFEPNVSLLRSRGMLCINDNVSKLGNISLINEKCNELMKNKSTISKKHKGHLEETINTSNCKCPYYSQKEIEDLSDQILNREAISPETLIDFGKKGIACPYFATRKALNLCDLILTPYNILLNKNARESWDLSLKNNIIIIDEAHNLLETISYIYSNEIDSKMLVSFVALLKEYYDKYEKKFNLKTRQYFRAFQKIILNVNNLLNTTNDNTMTTTKFLYDTGSLNLNLFKIMKIFDDTQLWRKLHGFYLTSETLKNQATRQSSPVYGIKTFLESFSDSHEDTLIGIENIDKEVKRIKFFLLNPAEKLKEIVKECRTLILIGGTMKPIEQLMDAFIRVCSLPREKIRTFSCGHIIDKNQLIAMPIGTSKNGIKFHFTFEERNNISMFNALLDSIMEISSFTPNGIVVFFPSYVYLETFKKCVMTESYDKLSSIKDIFFESKDATSSLLNNYSTKAITNKGAILFGVIGGKLSEGINFCDKLGRCIIMIGLPYPNKNSIEISSKMTYLQKHVSQASAQNFYNSLCMHAVNQGIGRAIRHRNDYATIILIDDRYQSDSIQKQLPNWIVDKIVKCNNFKDIIDKSIEFFKNKL